MRSYFVRELSPEIGILSSWRDYLNTKLLFLFGTKLFKICFMLFFCKRGYKYRKPKDEETVEVEKKTKKSMPPLKSNLSTRDKESKVKITTNGAKYESKNGLNEQSSEKKNAKSDLKRMKALRHVRKSAFFTVNSS